MDISEFKNYLKENGIDEMHNEYDDLWSSFMFGGRGPNEVYESVNALYNAGKISSRPTAPYHPGPDQEHDLQA